MVSDASPEFTVDGSVSGLNPCSNGIWSLTLTGSNPVLTVLGLNPCSNGIWSLTLHQSSRWMEV